MKRMSKVRERKEGLVEKILEKEDLTTEEIKDGLLEKDISFVRSYDRAFTGLFCLLVVLWVFPAVAKYSGWRFLDFFSQLPRVDFPIAAIVVSMAFLIVAVALEVKVSSRRRRQGGCDDEHETVIIIREGPYRVIRHPGYLAELIYFPLLPIVLSRWVPFTFLAVVYCVTWIVAISYLVKAEDNFNLRKWGDEYRQFMREVPALNFMRGLINLRKKTG